uniref:Uncharacterized protein n=1 Tax=Ananas comosus var. bracteatus TaxID=296719 RepID=A0A6V7PX99_ANACO|nr:unnamed protein product [Ananas comosus var. bracteatus]
MPTQTPSPAPPPHLAHLSVHLSVHAHSEKDEGQFDHFVTAYLSSTGRATATSGLAKQRPPGGVLQGGVGTGDSESRGEGRGAREAGGEVERGVAAGDVAPVEGGGHARRPAHRSGGVGRRRDLRRLLLLLRNGVMVHAGRCTQRRRAGTQACCGCFFFVIMV